MPPPSDVGEYLQAVELRVALRQAFQRQRDVHLLEIARLDAWCRRRSVAGSGSGASGPAKLAKRPLDLSDNLFVVDRARGGDHHVRARDSCAPDKCADLWR